MEFKLESSGEDLSELILLRLKLEVELEALMLNPDKTLNPVCFNEFGNVLLRVMLGEDRIIGVAMYDHLRLKFPSLASMILPSLNEYPEIRAAVDLRSHYRQAINKVTSDGVDNDHFS